jgi:hypothetical protein
MYSIHLYNFRKSKKHKKNNNLYLNLCTSFAYSMEGAPDGAGAVAPSALAATGVRVLGLAVGAGPGVAGDVGDSPSRVEPELLGGLHGRSVLQDRCGCGSADGPCESLPLACGLREGSLCVRGGGGVGVGYQMRGEERVG